VIIAAPTSERVHEASMGFQCVFEPRASRSSTKYGRIRTNPGTFAEILRSRPTRVWGCHRGQERRGVLASVPRFVRFLPYFVEDLEPRA
jgi:hypothetical protein